MTGFIKNMLDGDATNQTLDVANSERIEELKKKVKDLDERISHFEWSNMLEKRIEKLEQLTKSIILDQYIRMESHGFYANEKEQKILFHLHNKSREIMEKVGRLEKDDVPN